MKAEGLYGQFPLFYRITFSTLSPRYSLDRRVFKSISTSAQYHTK